MPETWEELDYGDSRSEVEDELDVVVLTEGTQQLGCQMAVAVVDLVEVLHAVGLARPLSRPLGLRPASIDRPRAE